LIIARPPQFNISDVLFFNIPNLILTINAMSLSESSAKSAQEENALKQVFQGVLVEISGIEPLTS